MPQCSCSSSQYNSVAVSIAVTCAAMARAQHPHPFLAPTTGKAMWLEALAAFDKRDACFEKADAMRTLGEIYNGEGMEKTNKAYEMWA